LSAAKKKNLIEFIGSCSLLEVISVEIFVMTLVIEEKVQVVIVILSQIKNKNSLKIICHI